MVMKRRNVKLKCWKRKGDGFVKGKTKIGEIGEINVWKGLSGTHYTTKVFKLRKTASMGATSTQTHSSKKKAISFASAFVKKHDCPVKRRKR